MKLLADKFLTEGYARQTSLAQLKAREDRIAHQIALLKQSQARFESASPSAAAGASPVAAAAHAHDAADVPRCVEAIKQLQAKTHNGANEEVLVARLGAAIEPKVHSTPPLPPSPPDSRFRSAALSFSFSRTRR